MVSISDTEDDGLIIGEPCLDNAGNIGTAISDVYGVFEINGKKVYRPAFPVSEKFVSRNKDAGDYVRRQHKFRNESKPI